MKKLFKFPNGDKYEGDIKSGKRSGIGTYTWKDGSKYKGYWKNNKKHGYGEFKDKKGDKVTAIWKNGKFSEHVNKRALEKIDLRYLRENLNLKKFLKLIYKNKSRSGNDRSIFYDFTKACSNKINTEQMLSDAILDNEKFYYSLEGEFIGGDFFELISDNFKIVYNKGVAEPKTKENKYIYEMKHSSYDFTVVYSKVDKFFYIITYQSWDYTNDGFYCREKFKTKNESIKYIKSEIKVIKKENFARWKRSK